MPFAPLGVPPEAGSSYLFPARLGWQRAAEVLLTGDWVSAAEAKEWGLVRDVVAPGVRLTFDTSKPDGSPRKLLDVGRLHALGWRHRIGLQEGIAGTYRWFLEHWEDPELRLGGGPGVADGPGARTTSAQRRA